mmetsp:Transcript_50310/g.58719  ORF Transcript_50310/g.58719 Transcript_50310/m.58719 type:complete len:258 (+) Transcript_50310:55-828(+)
MRYHSKKFAPISLLLKKISKDHSSLNCRNIPSYCTYSPARSSLVKWLVRSKLSARPQDIPAKMPSFCLCGTVGSHTQNSMTYPTKKPRIKPQMKSLSVPTMIDVFAFIVAFPPNVTPVPSSSSPIPTRRPPYPALPNIQLFWRSSRGLFEFKLSRNSDIGPWDVIHRSSCRLLRRRSLVSRFDPWSEDAVVVEFGAPLFGSAPGDSSGEILSASLFSALDDVLLSELPEPSLLSSLLAERDSLLRRFWRRFLRSSTN